MVKKMIVNIKFFKNRMNDSLAGYVTKSSGSWKGCRTTDKCKMKIVLVSQEIKGQMIENVLYRTTIIPMKEKDGFVAIKAEPVQFDARVETKLRGRQYSIEIKFGNKTLVYDPYDKKQRKCRTDFQTFRHILELRPDIKDLAQVIEDFEEAVNVQAAYNL